VKIASAARPVEQRRTLLPAVVFVASTLVALLLVTGGNAAAALDLPTVWEAPTDTWITYGATLIDLDGDGRLDVLTAGVGGVTALSAEGKRLWQFNELSRLECPVAVLERPGKPPLLYIGDNQGKFVCLDTGGQVVWRTTLTGTVNWTAPCICDLTGDGKFEVVQGDRSHHVTALEAESGNKIWEAEVVGSVDASMAVADLDGDGKLEVVVPCSIGEIQVLNSDGTARWHTKVANELYSAPVVFTASQGGKRIVAGSGDAVVTCLDAVGNVLWKHGLDSSTDSSGSVGDIDQDGRPDVFLVTEGGQIWRFDEDGNPLWQLLMGSRSDAPGDIADVVGDGHLQFVLCAHDGRLLVLDASANVLLDTHLSESAYNATPAIADVDGDGLRELVITGGGAMGGEVYCLRSHAPAGAPVEWGSFRADVRMSGEWRGHAAEAMVAVVPPQDLTADGLLSSTRSLEFKVENRLPQPDKDNLQATIQCLQPNALRTVVTAPINLQETVMRLPTSLFTPGTYRFAWKVEDAQGTQVVAGGKEINLQPFANDVYFLEETTAQAETTAARVEAALPLSAQALRAQVLGADAAIKRAVAVARSLPGASAYARDQSAAEVGRLIEDARHLRQAATVIEQSAALGSTTSLLLFEGNPWNQFRVESLCPDQAQTQLPLGRHVVSGEHEPVVLNLFNVTNRPLRVRVVAETPKPGPAVRLMHAVAVPAGNGKASYDALPEIDESGVVVVAPLTNEQVWADIDSSGLAPGDYSATIRCLALNGAGVDEGPTAFYVAIPAPVSEARISLKVLDFQAAPPSAFHHCNWAYVSGSLLRDYPEATYKDLLEHGTNVFVTNKTAKATFDDQGRLVGKVDFSAMDEELAYLSGQDVIVLLQGLTQLQSESGKYAEGSDVYNRALVPFLDAVVKHMADLGFSTNNFAYYPYDEPGSDGWPSVNVFIQRARLVREADPRIQIYVDGGPPSLEMYEAMIPYVDIWQTTVHRLPTEGDLQRLPLMRRKVKQIWTYDGVDEGKTDDVVANFLADAIYCFVNGLTGNGYWTYCTQNEDPWERTLHEFMLVYPGLDKPVSSRRWEAVRQSIQDYRVLAGLRSLVQQAGAKGVAPDVCGRARQLLDTDLPAQVKQAPLTGEAIAVLRANVLSLGDALAKAMKDMH